MDQSPGTGSYNELACCSAFMYSCRENQVAKTSFNCAARRCIISRFLIIIPRRPACRLIQTSWDFVASELAGPLPVTYVEDIAILVQRLGMIWQTSRPEEGERRAEGNGRIIYSTLVQSIGPIIRYAQGHIRGVRDDKYGKTADGTVPTEFLLIPTGEADMMRFVILPWYGESHKL